MADISLILIVVIATYEIATLLKTLPKPFSCPPCLALWIAAISFTIIARYELILPTYLIAVFYENQRMF
jgi:hypothetical protein